jgi:predicted negative regulator of RcsB-dependent stress response
MAAYDLEEQEQLEELKAWWKQYGNLILLAVGAALFAFAAWNGWKYYQRDQAGQAGAAYAELQKAARDKDLKKIGDATGLILERFPRTTYAALGALISAKAHFDAGDLKTAKAQLQWVVSNARDSELQDIARLRLAVLLLDGKSYDEALKTLETPPGASFEGLYASARGDVLLAQGKKAEARAAYQVALDKTGPKQVAARDLLQLKIDALGGGR